MNRLRRAGDRYVIEFDRHELGIIIMGLGWAEDLIKSEAAFPDYVHCTRPEFHALIAELVNAVKAPEIESDDVAPGAS